MTLLEPARLSRRDFLAGVAAGAAAWTSCAVPMNATATSPGAPGTWRTWLLATGDEVRPPPPSSPTTAEVGEVLASQAQGSASTVATVAKWANGPAILPWTDLTLDLIRIHQPNPVRAGRALALLHAALADTVVATWDARAAYPRSTPPTLDPSIVAIGDPVPDNAAFPSEHAAVAAAAATVLTYLFPEEPAGDLAALAEEAANSRLTAGTNVRSDVEAGQAIGRAVGQRAIARGRSDGSSRPGTGGSHPSGEGTWQPTPPAFVQQPLDPLAGTWTTWVVASGDQYRPPPPPAYRSPAWEAELAAVQDAVARRSPEQTRIALDWAGGPGSATPAGRWTAIARDLIVRGGLDLPHAARALALTTVAMADGFVCCWDAKYAYWTERPITADPTLAVLFPTPPFPSYTSGHATISAAAAAVLGHLFPDAAENLVSQAETAADSRVWAGIHFPIDCDLGTVGGRQVGRLVVARARGDGAEPPS